MKKPEEVMEILEAFDLAGTLRGAAALAGCDHKMVAWVRQRELTGGPPAVERVFQAKIDELVDRSNGRIRADVAHEKLVAIGYQGSARTIPYGSATITNHRDGLGAGICARAADA